VKNSSPGMDMIHNSFFSNIPEFIFDEIYYLFNTSWITGDVPQKWKLSVVVPICKPGKEKRNINSYRPISLLSCLGKLMERIV
jgi:hypothetical protein